MTRFLPAIIALVVFTGAAAYSYRSVPNPDPNHTHADFAVWIDGERWDFTDQKYMSEAYDPNGDPLRVDPMRKYLHLHDNLGNVMHRHKPGLTIGEFFASLGFTMTDTCMTTDTGGEFCTTNEKKWRMIVNGDESVFTPSFVFEDGDQLLFSYGASDTAYIHQWEEMTNEACTFSQTCPWRGTPPAENCIADPAVPCVIPE